MKSIIKDIFFGFNGTAEALNDTEEYRQIYDKVNTVYEQLKNKLPEEYSDEIKNLKSLFSEKENESSISYFVEGVKIGILIGIEACN